MKRTSRCSWSCPIAMLLTVGYVMFATAQEAERPWEGSAALCGVSFTILKDEWVVVAHKEASSTEQCSGEIRHKLYDKLVEPRDPEHFWKISLSVNSKAFDNLRDLYEVHRENDRWFVGRGASEVPAYEIRGRNWWGLRADSIPFRAYGRDGGGYVGMSEATWAIVSATVGSRTAILTAGSGADDLSFPLILNSLRFDAAR